MNSFLQEVCNFGFFKVFPKRSVYSLYYDDDNYQSIADNLAGISPRNKYRLRWYSFYKNTDFFGWQLEKKIKSGYIGYKKLLKLSEDISIEELDFSVKCFSKYTLHDRPFFPLHVKPRIFCCYSRDYYAIPSGQRLTIDSNIKYLNFTNNQSFNFSQAWISTDYNILELNLFLLFPHARSTVYFVPFFYLYIHF